MEGNYMERLIKQVESNDKKIDNCITYCRGYIYRKDYTWLLDKTNLDSLYFQEDTILKQLESNLVEIVPINDVIKERTIVELEELVTKLKSENNTTKLNYINHINQLIYKKS